MAGSEKNQAGRQARGEARRSYEEIIDLRHIGEVKTDCSIPALRVPALPVTRYVNLVILEIASQNIWRKIVILGTI